MKLLPLVHLLRRQRKSHSEHLRRQEITCTPRLRRTPYHTRLHFESILR